MRPSGIEATIQCGHCGLITVFYMHGFYDIWLNETSYGQRYPNPCRKKRCGQVKK